MGYRSNWQYGNSGYNTGYDGPAAGLIAPVALYSTSLPFNPSPAAMYQKIDITNLAFTGSGSNLTYQWAWRRNGAGSWTNFSTSATTSFSFGSAAPGGFQHDNYTVEIRLTVTNGLGSDVTTMGGTFYIFDLF